MTLERGAMLVFAVLLALGAAPALAHEGAGAVGGFLSGFTQALACPRRASVRSVGKWISSAWPMRSRVSRR